MNTLEHLDRLDKVETLEHLATLEHYGYIGTLGHIGTFEYRFCPPGILCSGALNIDLRGPRFWYNSYFVVTM